MRRTASNGLEGRLTFDYFSTTCPSFTSPISQKLPLLSGCFAWLWGFVGEVVLTTSAAVAHPAAAPCYVDF